MPNAGRETLSFLWVGGEVVQKLLFTHPWECQEFPDDRFLGKSNSGTTVNRFLWRDYSKIILWVGR